MEFRLLGPLEAIDGATPLTLGSRKPRALLARLVLDVTRTVSVERLVDDLWGDDLPESAVKMVQIHVSQLRKVLPEDVLRTRPPGYVIDVPPEAVDVNRFKGLRAEGRAALEAGDAATAAGLLRDALALWRGPALAEFSEPFAQVEGAHLEELRLLCLEDRIEADLALRQHADLAAELEALVARHPLREGVHRQLLLSLYRAGRQAEALSAYERFRRTLDDELGIEPSAALKALQLQILNQDRELEPAPRREPWRRRSGLFGRAEEHARLQAALDEARAGRGQAVLVAGRSGIGKTRLVTELADQASEGGATVLAGRCIRLMGAGLPYLPFADALRSVAPALDDLASRGGGRAAEGPTDSRLRLFQEVLLVLEQLSATDPLVLVLEDLHWADASTLDLLAFLAHAIRERRILLLATYRSEEARPGDPVQRLTAGLAGSHAAEVVELEPLDHAAVEALLLAGGDEPIAAEFVDEIFRRSEGNPLFARELLAAAARGDADIPPALRDLLLADVACLGEEGRWVLRVAAAVGRDIPYGLLRAVLALDEYELSDALREAVEHDLLVADQAGGTFRFRHPLFAEAVYGTLIPGDREGLHERIARALTEEPALAASASAAAESAQHWAAAGRPAEALAASLQAARDAERVSGLTEALAHVERVLELWDEVPDAEALAGVALPSIVSRAAELAGMDARRAVGVLDPEASLDLETVAARLGVSRETAANTLAALEQAGLVERRADGGFRAAPLAMTEAGRLYPAAVVLESVAVRRSPPFDAATLDRLRAANADFRAAAKDPAAAIAADDDFHRRLTAGCGNEELLAALLPIKHALLRYERVYMAEPARIERSAAQHDEIIAALESGDHAGAAQLLRENMASGLPDLSEAVEP
jgi:DNA-binding SARP family transcriptional activator/DNA-binding GntR family transcriptional regulator